MLVAIFCFRYFSSNFLNLWAFGHMSLICESKLRQQENHGPAENFNLDIFSEPELELTPYMRWTRIRNGF